MVRLGYLGEEVQVEGVQVGFWVYYFLCRGCVEGTRWGCLVGGHLDYMGIMCLREGGLKKKKEKGRKRGRDREREREKEREKEKKKKVIYVV
jgi:hypothetical protein